MPISDPIISVRPCAPTDFADLERLHAEGFERPWSETDFAEMFQVSGTLGWIAVEARSGKLLAFLMIRIVFDTAEVLTLVTAQKARSQGLGLRLLDTACLDLKGKAVDTLLLEVAEDNDPAIRLYRRAGFRDSGRRKGYYMRKQGCVDACVMTLDLKED